MIGILIIIGFLIFVYGYIVGFDVAMKGLK